ncbi:hypothetical protein [Pelagibacterium limicola]|uniref:hypothetical protein n=1 Tax=Pelagibacterium limicola TaxID=2791022 RepID=UPI0018AFB22F|nr:hypothetical protein [Pelagibacterium limicola]
MRPRRYTNAMLAVMVAFVPTLVAFVGLGAQSGLGAGDLIAICLEVTGGGLVVLFLVAAWREHNGASRPGWPFIFTLGGGVNVALWALMTAFAPQELPEGAGDSYFDLTAMYPQIALLGMLGWSLMGFAFSVPLGRRSAGGWRR